jgi:putative ABC transport system permease protein
MIGQLVFRNSIHRPVRAFVSVAAVAMEVTLVLIIVGLTGGMLQEVGKRLEGVGADIMVQPSNASIMLAFNGAPMTIKIGDKLATLKYVQAVAPVLLQFNSSGGIDVIWGIEPSSFHAVSGGFVFLEGHDMEGPDDLLVDDWAAKSKNIQAGQTYRLLEHGRNRGARQGRANISSAANFAGSFRRARQSFHLFSQVHSPGAHQSRD